MGMWHIVGHTMDLRLSTVIEDSQLPTEVSTCILFNGIGFGSSL